MPGIAFFTSESFPPQASSSDRSPLSVKLDGVDGKVVTTKGGNDGRCHHTKIERTVTSRGGRGQPIGYEGPGQG